MACHDRLRNARVDVLVDNQTVFTTVALNISLHLSYIPTNENPADSPSRRLSATDSQLTQPLWRLIQHQFRGREDTCDLTGLNSNAMHDHLIGNSLPHFTPYPSPGTSGVNLFAQDLSRYSSTMQRPYVFPPLVLVGPVIRFLDNSV